MKVHYTIHKYAGTPDDKHVVIDDPHEIDKLAWWLSDGQQYAFKHGALELPCPVPSLGITITEVEK